MMRRGGAAGGRYEPVPTKEEQLGVSSKERLTTRPSGDGKPFRVSDYRLDPDDPNTLRTRDVPWGPVSLAIFLMLLGMTCLVLAWLHVTQEILGKEQAEYGFTIIGLLTFIPGFYHTRIAYYTWRGYKGFSWDQIPAS